MRFIPTLDTTTFLLPPLLAPGVLGSDTPFSTETEEPSSSYPLSPRL